MARRAAPRHTALLLALVAVESSGVNGQYVQAPNGYWSAGLTQTSSEWWGRFGLNWQTAIDPQRNLDAGAAILRADLRAEGGDVGYALERYNSGPQGVGVDWTYASAVERWLIPMRVAMRGGAA